MSDPYDLVVIGGGPGGYNAAIRAGQLKLRTAIVDKGARLGGTCLNIGCIPSKALLHASELYEAARKTFPALGIGVSNLTLDLAQMMRQKDEAVEGLTKGVEFLMRKNKVDYLRGTGRIAAAGRVEVAADAGGEATVLETKAILVATGSDAAPLPGIGIDERRIVSSTGALVLERTPEKLLVIGGGVIGLELGSVWRRLGAEVTVVEFLDRIVPAMDSEISRQLQRILTKQGMRFELAHKVTRIDEGAKLNVTIEPAAGGQGRVIDADVALVSIGRRPYTAGLGLETVGVRTDRRGFIETDHFKTSVAGVYAIGDCTHGVMLAHKAEEEGIAAAQVIAGQWGHVNYDAIPSVVYTSPEVASIGKTEEELKAAGVAYRIGKFPFTANSRARTNHETEGFVKILEDNATKRVVGAHMIGPGVSELIGEVAVAMEFAASAEDIARTCHAHPGFGEAIREAAKGVDGWIMQM
jgi:dihydrolipoamide dehydrogenase